MEHSEKVIENSEILDLRKDKEEKIMQIITKEKTIELLGGNFYKNLEDKLQEVKKIDVYQYKGQAYKVRIYLEPGKFYEITSHIE